MSTNSMRQNIANSLILPMSPSLAQEMPALPLATRAKPTVDPTMLCVPDTGSFSKVAIKSQPQAPATSMRFCFTVSMH